MHSAIRLALVTALVCTVGGCATGKSHYATSVVDYLYPNTKDPVVTPSIPTLTLPMRVGIAFVPASRPQSTGWFGWRGAPRTHAFSLTENKKAELMQQVADHFKKYPFVKSIEIIPSTYLTSGGSFANLDQIRKIHGIDVIALLSYDQAQFTDEGFLSLTYWTIIGAYIVPGSKNDTHTMLDAVVYDIASRKMLFRAPGTSHIKGRSTPINLSEELRNDSTKGFNDAGSQMIVNLDSQLAVFKDKVKNAPQDYKVVHSPGYTGGGSLDQWMLVILAFFIAAGVWGRQRTTQRAA